MGALWNTPAQQTGFAQNFPPEQMIPFQQFSKQIPSAYDITQNPLFQNVSGAIGQQLSPYGSDQFNQQFQEAFVNPAMKNYEQEVLPTIKSQYYSPSGVYGGALNQAINKSAGDLTQGLNQLRAQYGLSSQQAGIANALGLFSQQSQGGQNYYSQLFGASPVSPLVQGPQSGILKDIITALIGAGGTAASGLLARR